MILLNHVTNDITATTINGAAIGGGSATIPVDDKTAAYTVVAGDLGKIIRTTTGTGAINLPSCATVGLGFNFIYVNATSGTTSLLFAGSDATPSGATDWTCAKYSTVRLVVTDASAAGKWQILNTGVEGAAQQSTAVGRASIASATGSIAIGNAAAASGARAISIGATTASATDSTAIGTNSLQQGAKAIIGAGAVAIGGSYAAGADSFSAAGGDNTGTYGAQGNYSVAIGHQAKATSGYGLALGLSTAATNTTSSAIGANSAATGSQSTGAGAMSLGGSYASGTDSFAAGIGNSTATYGAQTASAVAVGYNAKATGLHGLALGYVAQATAQDSAAIGYGARSAGNYSIALGTAAEATGLHGVAIGGYSIAGSNIGRIVLNNGYSAVYGGDSQAGLFILRAQATVASTNYPLTTNNSAPASNNMINMGFSTCWAFHGIVAARQSSGVGGNAAAWEIKGAAIRGASGSVSLLGTPTVTSISGTVPTGWAVAISADTTNHAIFIVFNMGGTTMNITVCATIHTTELFAI